MPNPQEPSDDRDDPHAEPDPSALREELWRCRSVVDAALDVIYMLDTDCRFRLVNDRFVETTGVPREELLGEHIGVIADVGIASREDMDAVVAVIEEVLDGETDVGRIDTTVDTPIGTYVVENRFTALVDDGEVIGVVNVIRDVTEERSLQRELAAQRDELATVNDLNEVIRGINRILVDARTRREIEAAVVERLADAAQYAVACVGEFDAREGRVTVAHAAPSAATDGSRATNATDGTSRTDAGGPTDASAVISLDDATADAIGAGETVELDGDGAGALGGAFGAFAADADLRAALFVSLAFRGTVQGVLAVGTRRADGFEPRERDVFAELGESIAHAVVAVRRRDALLSEHVHELELYSEDAAAALSSAVEPPVEVTVHRTVPDEWGDYLHYVTVRGVSLEALEAEADRVEWITRIRRIDVGDEASTVEVTTPGRPFLSRLISLDGRIERATLENGTVTLTVRVPETTTVRAVVDAVRDALPDAKLAFSRSLVTDTGPAASADGLDRLTAKQRAALEAAYYGGYFEWPRRGSSAAELAEAIGVAPSTFKQHLRIAEEKVLSWILRRSAESPDER